MPGARVAGKRNAEVGSRSPCCSSSLADVPLPASSSICSSPRASASPASWWLLVALYTTNPCDFSSFPSLLLLFTLFGLALQVCSTVLHSQQGHAGVRHSGIRRVRIGGNYAGRAGALPEPHRINFIVITKGADRVAEVAARFTLDAMPGKQMAIDADLSAGPSTRSRPANVATRFRAKRTLRCDGRIIEVDEGRRDRRLCLITAINIVGGIFIGAFQRGLPIARRSPNTRSSRSATVRQQIRR